MNWWRHVAAMELRKILAYRTDFWVTFLGQTLLQVTIARALWSSIFLANNLTIMNGFTVDSITLYSLLVSLGMKMLSGENFGFLFREIYDGGFTKYLIYPLSFFQYKIVTYLTHTAFYAVQLIIFTTLYKWSFDGTHFLFLFQGVSLFFLAAMTYLGLAMMLELLALYAENVWSLMVILRFSAVFLGGGPIPLTFFPTWALDILKYTPFPYMISLPIRTVLGQAVSGEIFQGCLILVFWIFIFSGCVQLIWKQGQKSYTGVGI